MKKLLKIISIVICAAVCLCAVKKTISAIASGIAAFKTVKLIRTFL